MRRHIIRRSEMGAAHITHEDEIRSKPGTVGGFSGIARVP